MNSTLAKIRKSSANEIKKSSTAEELEKIRLQYMGRKGALTLILRALKDLPEERRRLIGQEANYLRTAIENLLAKRLKELKSISRESVLRNEWLDITRPGVKQARGHLHPITKIKREIEAIFYSMGFEVVEGPELELEYYNFDSLNMPATHPAREMQDTWWLKLPPVTLKKQGRVVTSRLLMSTQVTQNQVRYMEKNNPPFRIIMPGTVFRREATDASHETQFTQMDGLMVDKKVSLADLKGIMETVLRRLFGPKIKTRLRAGYFPFVEPGVEMDIECLYCRQSGCSVCKQSGWIEVFPGGVVHPNVFKAAGYNPKNWQGIAWDIGVDRIAILKYKIPDLRLLRSGDLRFLKQF